MLITTMLVTFYSTTLLLYACSDILTPLPALGMPFEIDDLKGPIIEQPIR